MKYITRTKREYKKVMNSLQFFKEYSGEDRTKIADPKAVFKKYKYLNKLDKEVFIVAHLNTKSKIISEEIISVGILNASIIHPREVFKTAILKSAARIILIHNHPSGDPTPSEEDLNINNKLAEAGELLDIQVIDSVIIGDDY